jgi:hypothetical protein
MQFLAPLFFAALAGLAIPVLLHLTQREKKQIVRFPSLMFVRRIPYQSVRRRKIQNWLLLAVRMAALALIILAFTRPLLDRANVPTAAANARELVILLDTSYSMGFGDHWTQAQAAGTIGPAGLGRCGDAEPILDAVLASTESRGQHPRRIDTAEARGRDRQRFSTRWMAG